MRDTAPVKISAIRLDRLVLPLDPPFPAAWDPEPRRRFAATIVRVETDAGVVGVGSGDSMNGFEAFAHLFVGQDPLAIARHVRVIETIDFHAGRYWPLEVALWDIVGQVAGMPVATLFGGASAGMPVYASSGVLRAPEDRAESALRLREEGFRALKSRVDPRRLDEGLAAVEATRAAVGSSMALMVDLNQGWRMPGDATAAIDLVAARRIADRLAELDVLWLEEPLPGSDLQGLASLRAAGTGVRIAGGEMTRTFAELVAALDADAFDVHQPDVVLAGMTLTQLVRPGAPVVYGGFTSNVDMQSGAPAFGTPEYMRTAMIGGQLARRYAVPYRSSNVSAANSLDAQAAYESVFALWGAIMGGVNLLMHGAGWMEGGLHAGYEKVILDAELLGMVAAFLDPVVVDEETLGLDAIREVGPGGHFFGAAHTQARYRTAFHRPILSDWRNYESWEEAGSPQVPGKANRIWKELLAAYEAPPMDVARAEELAAFVERRRAEGGVPTDY